MSDVEADSMWTHCALPDDDIGDLEATPRPAPLSRIQPRSIDVDSWIDHGDTQTETEVLSCTDESETDIFPETSESSQAMSEWCVTPSTPDSTITTPPVTRPRKSPPPNEMAPRIQAAPRTAPPLPMVRPHLDHPTAVSNFAASTTSLMPVFVPRTAATAPVEDNTHCTEAPPTTNDTAPWLAATQLIDDSTPIAAAPVVRPVSALSRASTTHLPRPLSVPHTVTSPLSEIDILTEIDFQCRQEEQDTARLAEEQAAMRLADEYEQASQERLRITVCIFEDVSPDETAGPRSSIAEDSNSDDLVHDSPPQMLYCDVRAQRFAKRRSKQKARQQYPVKRGGGPSDALVVVKYPDINAKFIVQRFGLQEMDARHGEASKFRRAWLSDYQADLRGYHGDNNLVSSIRLYYTDCIYRAQLPDLYEEMYYVDLFFRNKFYATFGKQQPAATLSLQYQAWCNFVTAYINSNSREANAYENSLRGREERFYSKSALGVAMKIHALSMKKEIPCTVPVDVECPSCYPGSSRETLGSKSPPDLVELHSHLHELLNKQSTTPVVSQFSDRVMVKRLEAEVLKLKADAECQRQQIDSLANESKERYEALQANIGVEVASQLSHHFRVLSGSVLSATPPH